MLYEMALSVKHGFSDGGVEKLRDMVASVARDHGGDILVFDDWGHLKLPQDTRDGASSVRMLYLIYTADAGANGELVRRLRLTEGLVRHLIVAAGDDAGATAFVQGLKTPYSKRYNGSVTDTDEDESIEGDTRRKYSKQRRCYFKAKNIKADWKDPKTYSWLVNEFGKLSPARMSSVSRRHQRLVTKAVKRARNISLISHLSNHVARAL